MWEVSSYQWIVSYEEYSGYRPRRVDAELDPAGRSKDLVGKGLGTVVQYVQDWPGDQFYNTYPFKRNFWKALNFDKKSEGGSILHITLNDLSENIEILLSL